MHERYRQTADKRQTTDGRTTTYSERELEFTFAKNKRLTEETDMGTIRPIGILGGRD